MEDTNSLGAGGFNELCSFYKTVLGPSGESDIIFMLATTVGGLGSVRRRADDVGHGGNWDGPENRKKQLARHF